MYGCESWTIKKTECWRIDVFELWCWRRLESPLDCKELKPVNPRGNQSWIFIRRTDAEAEAPIFWPPDAKSQLIRKDPDAGKGWRQEEKGMTEDEMVGWNHCLSGYGFEQASGDGDGQGILACCSPWGHKESDMTEQLNKNKIYLVVLGLSCSMWDLSSLARNWTQARALRVWHFSHWTTREVPGSLLSLVSAQSFLLDLWYFILFFLCHSVSISHPVMFGSSWRQGL